MENFLDILGTVLIVALPVFYAIKCRIEREDYKDALEHMHELYSRLEHCYYNEAKYHFEALDKLDKAEQKLQEDV